MRRVAISATVRSTANSPIAGYFLPRQGLRLMDSSSVVLALRTASAWWDEVNDSSLWQDRIFHALSLLFGLISAVALIQLIRIECRVPEFGWTTQKVFHLLNFLVNGVRSLVFVFRRGVQKMNPIIRHILLDLPGLAFFTTYALLVLFWAEIYYQARSVSTDGLRPTFYTINAVTYVIQIALWLVLWWKPIQAMIIISKIFFAGVSFFAALGFLLYGGSSCHFICFWTPCHHMLKNEKRREEESGRRRGKNKSKKEERWVPCIYISEVILPLKAKQSVHKIILGTLKPWLCFLVGKVNLSHTRQTMCYSRNLNLMASLVLFCFVNIRIMCGLSYLIFKFFKFFMILDKCISYLSNSLSLSPPPSLSLSLLVCVKRFFVIHRLFLMLKRFPVESKGRRKKLQEVGYVTTICFLCFLLRCIMVCFNAFDKAADLDVLDHPILNLLYYLLVEILPSSLVLFILRKLPPKRGITQYHPIH
ncbi:unnamed protein product [Musa banksii]